MKLDAILAGVQKLKRTGPDSWLACCPAHDDRSPSLTIKRTEHTILLHCFGGCGAADVLDALGLTFDDLYADAGAYESKPIRYQPREVLEAVRDHSFFVGCCAASMANGRVISEHDREKLMRSAELLQQAARMAGL